MMAGTAPSPLARRVFSLPPVSSRYLAIVRCRCASIVSAWVVDGSTRANALVSAVRPSPQPRRNLGLTRLWLLKLTLLGIWLPEGAGRMPCYGPAHGSLLCVCCRSRCKVGQMLTASGAITGAWQPSWDGAESCSAMLSAAMIAAIPVGLAR